MPPSKRLCCNLQRKVQNSNISHLDDVEKETETVNRKIDDLNTITQSQESHSSGMEYSSSQESNSSKMDYCSSQESNTSKMDYSNSDNIACDSIRNVLEDEFEKDTLISELFLEQIADDRAGKSVSVENAPEISLYEISNSDTASEKTGLNASLTLDLCVQEVVENRVEKSSINRNAYATKRKLSADSYSENLMTIRERAVFSREEALAKWELAILIREQALEDHAAVLKEQEDILKELLNKCSPKAKRLKV